VTIESSGNAQGAEPVQIDGDIGCQLPLTIRPAHRSLVLVCAGSQSSSGQALPAEAMAP
jgi:hypothetical protein